ncbi:MAG: endonuclease III domain-containing protein [Nitrospinales bacterium]
MNNRQIPSVIRILEREIQHWPTPIVIYEGRKKNPFRILISCLISLRTRDEVTGEASKNLFDLADTPKGIFKLSQIAIEKAIYPAAFFRVKAKNIQILCEELEESHNGLVPDNIDDLLNLKGVGRKTANLTLILGFDQMGICVDTHVHRICNRWGYVTTKSADDTEMELRKKLNKKYWKKLNHQLVGLGQNLCKPISPNCDDCKLTRYCQKVGV